MKKLLLPALISLLTACTTTIPKHALIDASVKGDIRQFGGATRLKNISIQKLNILFSFLEMVQVTLKLQLHEIM